MPGFLNSRTLSRDKCEEKCTNEAHCEGFSFREKTSQCIIKSKSCSALAGECSSNNWCFFVKVCEKEKDAHLKEFEEKIALLSRVQAERENSIKPKQLDDDESKFASFSLFIIFLTVMDHMF